MRKRASTITFNQRTELDKFVKADPCADRQKVAAIAARIGLHEKQALKYLSRKRSFYSEAIRKPPSKREIEKMKAGLELSLAQKRALKYNNQAVSIFSKT